MRPLRLPLLVLVVLAALLLVPLESSARASAGNTWAGTWNSDMGKLTLSASGSGTYEGFYPGTVSGTVTGNVLEGTWAQPTNNPPKSGTFKFTMSADGHSFTGDWAYSGGGCGIACGWNGTCIEGPCTANGAGGTTTPPAKTTPTTTPNPDTQVTLSVKAPDGAYGASAKVANGTRVRFHVVVSPSLPAGASVIVEYPWQGSVNKLFDCGTSVCENTTSYRNAKITFHAAVVKDGTELTTSGTVTVTWAKRAPAVSAALSVKTPSGQFASLTQADVGKEVVLRAAATPRLPAGARMIIKTRQLGKTREYVLGGSSYACTKSLCDFKAHIGNAETWEFRVLVLRGSDVLANSAWVKVVWCYCHVKKRLYVNVLYHMDDFDPVYSRTPGCAHTAEPFDQDWSGVVSGNLVSQILFRKRTDVYSAPGHKLLSINYSPGEPVTGPTTDFGDFSYGDLPYDIDSAGRKIFPPTVCFGTALGLRMIPGTAAFVVTAKERALLVKVRVTHGAPNVCAGSVATLKMVDSDVSLGKFPDAPGLNKSPSTHADSFSITGFTPACPHEHSFDMHTPGFFPPHGRPGNWIGPWAELRVTLTCAPPPGAPGRGISEKECPLDS